MIKQDYSYLNNEDNLLIEKGFANYGIYHIRLSINFQQRERIHAFMELLASKYQICQYNMDNYGKHDLFFWCNDQRNRIGVLEAEKNDRDYSYVTLKANDKYDMSIYQEVCNLSEDNGYDDIEIALQYTCIKDKEQIKQRAKEYYETIKDQWTKYWNMDGKIKAVDYGNGNIEYRFFKKRAKNHFYRMSCTDLCLMAIA
jgi:hypothetical protein